MILSDVSVTRPVFAAVLFLLLIPQGDISAGLLTKEKFKARSVNPNTFHRAEAILRLRRDTFILMRMFHDLSFASLRT